MQSKGNQDRPDKTFWLVENLFTSIVGVVEVAAQNSALALQVVVFAVYTQCMCLQQGSDIFVWARQTDKPSEIVPAFVNWILECPTIERVELLRAHLGDEGLGILRRGVSERLLGRTNDGEYDFKNFSYQLHKLPEVFLTAFFGPSLQALEDLAITSNILFPPVPPPQVPLLRRMFKRRNPSTVDS